MPRPRKLIRPSSFHCNVPEDLKTKLDIYLFSTIENRVPYGAYSEFLAEAIRNKFEMRELDLSTIGPFPKGSIIRGPQIVLDRLTTLLKGQS